MTTPIPITAARPPRPEIIASNKASGRYEDAYLRASSMAQAGEILQTIGWVLGIFLFCGAIFVAHTATKIETIAADWLPPGGLTLAAIITVFLFWLIGELVWARGELLQAGLDSAVNSSPFLSDAQRAKVMSLR